jgi:hypothetical protein
MRTDGRTVDRQTDREIERQRDRETDLTKLTVAFRNFANAPRIAEVYQCLIRHYDMKIKRGVILELNAFITSVLSRGELSYLHSGRSFSE